MINLCNKLTVFIITVGEDVNYAACIYALQKQTVNFKLDIIKNYAPMSAAFQQMLDRCTTEYFIQVDSDMILYPNAIENLYNSMSCVGGEVVMKCFRLRDAHLNFPIYGIKIYKTDIFKKYPYNLEHVSCEVEQLSRIKADGYIYESITDILGEHSPVWSDDKIFERYFNLMQKYQVYHYKWMGELPRKLYEMFKTAPTIQNFYALAGMITGLTTPLRNQEKNFRASPPEFKTLVKMMAIPLVDLKDKPILEPLRLKVFEGKRLNILRLKDEHNWAYCHISRDQAKYSCHNIISERLKDMTLDKLKGVDVLYIPGPNMGYESLRNQLISHARTLKCKVVCGYAGEHEIMYPDADIIVSISAKFYPRLKQMYSNRRTPVVFLPESVDTEFFIPNYGIQTFNVGWAGRLGEVKRTYLLDQLIYPVKKQSDHGKQFFAIPDRSLQPMKEFYQSISVFVLTSRTEAMPRVVLESMACGLPVISTDVGSVRMLLDKDWIIPVNPENIVIEETNKRLTQLSSNIELRRMVGERNRNFIESNFSWGINQPIWDSFFENVAKGHFQSAEIYNQEYRAKYSILEPALNA